MKSKMKTTVTFKEPVSVTQDTKPEVRPKRVAIPSDKLKGGKKFFKDNKLNIIKGDKFNTYKTLVSLDDANKEKLKTLFKIRNEVCDHALEVLKTNPEYAKDISKFTKEVYKFVDKYKDPALYSFVDADLKFIFVTRGRKLEDKKPFFIGLQLTNFNNRILTTSVDKTTILFDKLGLFIRLANTLPNIPRGKEFILNIFSYYEDLDEVKLSIRYKTSDHPKPKSNKEKSTLEKDLYGYSGANFIKGEIGKLQ